MQCGSLRLPRELEYVYFAAMFSHILKDYPILEDSERFIEDYSLECRCFRHRNVADFQVEICTCLCVEIFNGCGAASVLEQGFAEVCNYDDQHVYTNCCIKPQISILN